LARSTSIARTTSAQRFADAHGMGEQQVLLQLGRIGGETKVVARSPKPVVTP